MDPTLKNATPHPGHRDHLPRRVRQTSLPRKPHPSLSPVIARTSRTGSPLSGSINPKPTPGQARAENLFTSGSGTSRPDARATWHQQRQWGLLPRIIGDPPPEGPIASPCAQPTAVGSVSAAISMLASGPACNGEMGLHPGKQNPPSTSTADQPESAGIHDRRPCGREGRPTVDEGAHRHPIALLEVPGLALIFTISRRTRVPR